MNITHNITHYTQHAIRDVSWDELAPSLSSQEGALWVDITAPGESDLALLESVFHFHPLALEDTRNQKQRPKVEEFADHLFIILNPLNADDGAITDRELDVFVGNNYIVTVHSDAEPVIHAAQNRIDPNRLPFPISATYLLYVLFDTVVDGYFPILESIENEIDVLGTQLLDHPYPKMLSRFFQLKQSLNQIWRIVWPQRDVVSVLMNHELVFIDHKSQYYLRDIGDHLARIADTAQTARDAIPSLINLYMSAVSNRLNHAINRLTLFTIVIGVLAVFGGFYGMNFQRTWPPFESDWGVPVVLMMMAGLSALLLTLLRRDR